MDWADLTPKLLQLVFGIIAFLVVVGGLLLLLDKGTDAVSWLAGKVRALLRRGFVVRAACPAACKLSARLTTPGGRLIAAARGALKRPGERVLRLKPTRSSRAWLARLERPRRVILTVTDGDDGRVVRRLWLRR